MEDYRKIKNMRKHNTSKSMNMRINNNKYNLRNFRKNNEYNNTTTSLNIKANNYKENGMNKIYLNNKNNLDFSNGFNNLNDEVKIINNNRYNFWSKNDTKKKKNTINYNGYNKYPEPNDIDDYLYEQLM